MDHQNAMGYTGKCNLCGSNNVRLVNIIKVKPDQAGIFSKDEWEIVKCLNCGLIFQSPIPDQKELDLFYSFSTQTDRKFVDDWFINNAKLQRPTWDRILRILRFYKPGGDLLDAGCGAGTFLTVARSSGYHVKGLEVSRFFVDYCCQQLGLEIIDRPLEKSGLPPESFDCVTAFDVIEHVTDPTQFLVEIRRILRPGGLVLLTTHDIGNIFARLYGPKWRYMAAIGHLTYFTRDTLRELLRRTGFEIIESGGFHTMDVPGVNRPVRFITEFIKLIVFRGLILVTYKPLVNLFPGLAGWRIAWHGTYLDHNRLMMRVGNQLAMDDDMVIVARV